ncbi:unnamed protein product [Paramecium octaurelia]|uniref:Uncharacterized protein n=1 Tax=Paramecium octaurelia TaxID=43137 RepID=A0A8S1XT03_PAROT|nr:unnamed protein product [Paramecium octaurelia]
MVKLLSKSPVALNSPTLQQWDNSFRENYEMYQTEIDKNTYALQRSIRGFWIFGKAFYPALTQHYSQKLELYQLKQQLGKIEQSEVNLYKTVDPSISTVLNKTFSTQWLWWNLQDISITAGLQVYAQLFNFGYSWRFGFLVLPYCARVFYDYATSYQNKSRAVEFLNWAIQYRKAKSQIERGTLDPLAVEKYQALYGTVKKGPLQVYADVIQLASQQNPNL